MCTKDQIAAAVKRELTANRAAHAAFDAELRRAGASTEVSDVKVTVERMGRGTGEIKGTAVVTVTGNARSIPPRVRFTGRAVAGEVTELTFAWEGRAAAPPSGPRRYGPSKTDRESAELDKRMFELIDSDD